MDTQKLPIGETDCSTSDSASRQQSEPDPNEHSANTSNRSSAADFTTALIDFAAGLSTIRDLDELCSFVAEQASALVDADEGAVYLETRPLSSDDPALQLSLPLCVRDRVLGVLNVARHPPTAEGHPHRGFSQEERRHLNLLGNITALAIANIKREQAARRRTDWRDRALELLQETGRVMGSTLELVPLMRRVIDVTARTLHAEAGMLAVLDSKDHLVLRAVAGTISRDIVGTCLAAESLIGWAAQHGHAALVPDPSADPRASMGHPASAIGFVPHTLLVAPLVTKGKTIGAIEVANKREGAFNEGDLHLLEVLALSAAAAIENARLYDRMQRQALQQESIIRVGHAISSAQDVDAVLQEVVESALSLIPTGLTAIVHLLDEEENLLRLHCDAGRSLWDKMKQPFPVGQGIAGHVFATLRVANVADVLTDPRYVPGPGRVVYRSLLAAPLIVEGKPLGTLSVTGLEPNAFGHDDEQMLLSLSTQAAVALRNARLLDSLRESEARYRGLVENVNALLVITDASGEITFVGGRWAEIMGYEPGEVIGLAYQDFCHPDDRSTLDRYISQLATSPSKVSDVRFQALRKDGTPRWCRVSAVSTDDESGQVERIYAVIHDVTDRIEAEQAIAHQASQLAALNTIASSISRSLDIDDIVRGGLQNLMSVLDLDAAGLGLLDPDHERIIPHTVIGLSPEFLSFTVPMQSAENVLAISTRQPIVIPNLADDPRFASHPGLPEMIKREGMNSLASAPVIAQDKVIGTLFVANRNTDAISPSAVDLLVTVGQQLGVALHNAQLYAQAEERAAQLEIAYCQLQDLARRKTQFVQNTSHELRTPLTFVRGYLELFLNGDLGSLTEKQHGVLAIMDIKSQRLVELVNDIASLLDVELNPADVAPTDLIEVMTRSLKAHRERANRADIALKTEWPDVAPVVQGNQQRLTQVFDHLLENAIKFSPSGGQIHVRMWTEHGNAFIRVADQGIGIPLDEQERIFDRFYQVDGSTTRRFGGTGLGLAIVKETIEAHGGALQIESNGVPGEGTAFTIILPLSKVPPAAGKDGRRVPDRDI